MVADAAAAAGDAHAFDWASLQQFQPKHAVAVIMHGALVAANLVAVFAAAAAVPVLSLAAACCLLLSRPNDGEARTAVIYCTGLAKKLG